LTTGWLCALSAHKQAVDYDPPFDVEVKLPGPRPTPWTPELSFDVRFVFDDCYTHLTSRILHVHVPLLCRTTNQHLVLGVPCFVSVVSFVAFVEQKAKVVPV
jgi:hypothetical protein